MDVSLVYYPSPYAAGRRLPPFRAGVAVNDSSYPSSGAARPFLPEEIMYRRGMGDPGLGQFTTQQAVQTAGGVVSGVLPGILVATHVIAATSALVPVIGAAIAGVTTLISALIAQSGCGPTCIETSQWANQAEPLLKQNISAYFSLPSPRNQAQQMAALANFDAIWAKLQQLCGQPGTGNAGARCVSDRQSGACTWKQTSSPGWPGAPPVGACWNWFNGYRDPIANDQVVSTPASDAAVQTLNASSNQLTAITQELGSLATGGSGGLLLLLVGGLLLFGAMK